MTTRRGPRASLGARSPVRWSSRGGRAWRGRPPLLRARLRADGLHAARLLRLGRFSLLLGAGAVLADAQHLERQALLDRGRGRLDREPGLLQLLDDLLGVEVVGTRDVTDALL